MYTYVQPAEIINDSEILSAAIELKGNHAQRKCPHIGAADPDNAPGSDARIAQLHKAVYPSQLQHLMSIRSVTAGYKARSFQLQLQVGALRSVSVSQKLAPLRAIIPFPWPGPGHWQYVHRMRMRTRAAGTRPRLSPYL